MIQRATLSEPLNLQAGDSVAVVNGVLTVTRDHHTVRTISLKPISQPFVGVIPFGDQHAITDIYWEKRMIGINAACAGVLENQTTGAVTFRWSDDTETPVSAWSDLAEIADQIDSDPILAKRILMAIAYRMSPGGENKTTQVGAQVSANLIADNKITYTSAQ